MTTEANRASSLDQIKAISMEQSALWSRQGEVAKALIGRSVMYLHGQQERWVHVVGAGFMGGLHVEGAGGTRYRIDLSRVEDIE